MPRAEGDAPTVSFLQKLRNVDVKRFHTMDSAILIVVTFAMVYVQSELAFLTVGVLIYIVNENSKKTANLVLQQEKPLKQQRSGKGGPSQPVAARSARTFEKPEKQQVEQIPWKKIHAPTFSSSCLETQMQEFSRRIAPSADGDKLVTFLAEMVQKLLRDLFPEAEVVGFTTCDVLQGTDFGLANPEIELVLTASPDMLTEALNHRASHTRSEFRGRPLPRAGKLCAVSLQKAVLRECISDLVATDKFKFRRSAFEGFEPNVTFVAPPAVTQRAVNIPVRFAVNATIPVYNYALVTECGQMDPRAKELILFVRRWAKFRGISQENKGHPTPYLWTLLVIYFLQRNEVDGGFLLPALGSFKLLGGLVSNSKPRQSAVEMSMEDESQKESVASIYHKFAKFYVKSFNWEGDIVSLHDIGKTGTDAEGTQTIAGVVRIEDPFVPEQSLSRHMTTASIGRLRGEFERAEQLFDSKATLTQLLEPWISPEHTELASGSVAGIFESAVSRQGISPN